MQNCSIPDFLWLKQFGKKDNSFGYLWEKNPQNLKSFFMIQNYNEKVL